MVCQRPAWPPVVVPLLKSPKPPPLYEGVGHCPVAVIPGTVLEVKTPLAYEPQTWTVSSASDGEQYASDAIATMMMLVRASRRWLIEPRIVL
jgi:hypothetical protein